MKKTLLYSALAVLSITGCQVEQELLIPEEPEVSIRNESKVFTATIEDDFGGDTKTSLDAEGNVLWKQGDQVSIFVGSTINEQYQVTDDSDGKTAAILNKVGDPGFVAGTDLENNVAFYPYASSASIAKSGSNYVISDIALPATQIYAADSFGNGAFPMAAVTGSTANMSLKFKNVLGGLKLQLKGTATISSITITGNNNEILCGEAEVTVATGSAPSISLTDASSKTVTMDCGVGVELNTETATSFIIALPPMTMTGGFTVVVTDTESKQMEIATSKSQTITRSKLLKMPAVEYVGTSLSSVQPNDFDPNKYLVYRANHTEYSLGRDWYSMESHMPGISGAKVEIKFQLAEGGNKMIASDNRESDWRNSLKLQNGSLIWINWPIHNDDADCFEHNIPLANYNLSETSLMVLYYDSTISSFSVNGQSTSCEGGKMSFDWLFSDYYSEYDEGRRTSYKGVPDGSKLFYVKVWDEEDHLIYIGYATTALNPNTSQNEYCWCSYNPATGEAAYVFANDAINQGGYQGVSVEPNSVDLGLSVKWASFNLGATKPEEHGDYFAWGENIVKNSYDLSNYIWCEGSNNTLIKYCNKSEYGYNGFTDSKVTLDPEDDVASYLMGDGWRIPTADEYDELFLNCNWEWMDDYNETGISGIIFSSKTNTNSIFIPSSGGYIGSTLNWATSVYTWTASLSVSPGRDTYGPSCADCLCYIPNSTSPTTPWINYNRRYFGFPIRPVFTE